MPVLLPKGPGTRFLPCNSTRVLRVKGYSFRLAVSQEPNTATMMHLALSGFELRVLHITHAALWQSLMMSSRDCISHTPPCARAEPSQAIQDQ